MQNNRDNPLNMFSNLTAPYASLLEKYFTTMPMLKPENFFQMPDNDLLEKQLHMFIHNGHVTLEYFKEISLSMAKSLAPLQNQFGGKNTSNQKASSESRNIPIETEGKSKKSKAKSANGKKTSTKKAPSAKLAKHESTPKTKPQAKKGKSAEQGKKEDPYALGARVQGLQSSPMQSSQDKNKKQGM
ncbi:Uncharacterised protein (plasmid) [Legionella adelaidensis]|uniref:Uncharacterized protein n=1 Tax=Legionella adelaidensis TaxID=45056 RepID=A0A0W0R1L8_9GAMM|nr:hypothetical protein [Legionella adelaidensis]KTC64875.1 hypothetical protein Lade_2169 [Legionella adelaidensis]VEH82954.1 Uncharacterised protein [Legionella adelaidensis]